MTTRNVLIYRNELIPLSETFILSQARALSRFQPLFAGLKRVRGGLDLGPHPVLTLCRSEQWQEKARRRIFLRTGHAQRFLQAIAQQNPQIIHAHFSVDAGAVLPIAKNLRIPLIVSLHGYDVTCTEEVMTRWPATRTYLRRKQELLEYAALFVCVSEYVRQQALSLGFPEKKLWVHRIGVDLVQNQRVEKYRDHKTVLFAGRLVEKKGCSHLIRAMSYVQKAIPETELVIAGDGPLRRVLEKEAALRCKNAVFLGHQSHADTKRWMQRAHVLVAPSVRARNGDAEGLPTVLCEAQAEGLTVIAFATEGVTEAVPAERRDSLPKAGDITGLAEEIIRFLKDDQARQQASDTGRRYMESSFDLAVQTQLLEDKYEEVIAGHHV